jgi:hypothetical protein
MAVTESNAESDPAPTVELFTLDLAANGGVLSPTNGSELQRWISKEVNFWSWGNSGSGLNGNHVNVINAAVGQLSSASARVQEALQYEATNKSALGERIEAARNHLSEAYVRRGLPHSSSTVGKRVEEIKQKSLAAAVAYLYVQMPSLPGENYQFDARDIDSWHGFLSGVFERYGIESVPNDAFHAATTSAEALKGKIEHLLDSKTKSVNRLHRRYEELVSSVTETEKAHKENVILLVGDAQKRFDDTIQSHDEKLEALRKAFKEEMSLRSPVEYWESRKLHHESRSRVMGRWAFGGIAAVAVVLGLVSFWVLDKLNSAGQPDAWRIAVLILTGVLGIWAVRLLVRIFLSHIHLTTDAAERVTMVKTYLSLIEGNKLPSDDDRKLILQALFRPAADGLVKDEGLPHPFLEALTRAGGK